MAYKREDLTINICFNNYKTTWRKLSNDSNKIEYESEEWSDVQYLDLGGIVSDCEFNMFPAFNKIINNEASYYLNSLVNMYHISYIKLKMRPRKGNASFQIRYKTGEVLNFSFNKYQLKDNILPTGKYSESPLVKFLYTLVREYNLNWENWINFIGGIREFNNAGHLTRKRLDDGRINGTNLKLPLYINPFEKEIDFEGKIFEIFMFNLEG